MFYYHNRVVIPHSLKELRQQLLVEHHSSPTAGHPSWRRTFATLLKHWWWRGMQRDVQKFCSECIICRRSKADRRGPASLSPLPVPDYPWQVVGLDFVTSLPSSGRGYTAVLVVVCHFTKLAHFIPCSESVTAEDTAELFVWHVIRLHGVPQALVSDRDPRFTSDFWQHLWKLLGTRLKMSTARHPQTDGLTERVNQTMQQLLRCYTVESGWDWVQHLPLVEFCYNAAVNESTHHSPFEATYGFQPPAPVDLLLPTTPDTPANVASMTKKLADTQALVRELLELSKQRQQVPGEDIEFNVNDYVYLSTHGLLLHSQPCHKLRDRHLGPYKVVQRVGHQAYKLDLPKSIKLHPIFHVNLLSKAVTTEPLREADPEVTDELFWVERITDVRLAAWPGKRGPHLQFMTFYPGYDAPEWSLLYDVDDTLALSD